MAKLTLEEARAQAAEMLDIPDTRSHVCSFLGSLEESGLMPPEMADSLADILGMARENNVPVLKACLSHLNPE